MQYHVHKLYVMNIVMQFCCVMCVHISADINTVYNVVSADSKFQSATTPTTTLPSNDATSQKPGE